MKQYPEYKDSGIEFFEKIPKHCELKRLCWLGRFSASGIDKKSIEGELPVKMVNYTNVYGNIKAEIDSSDNLMETTTIPELYKIYILILPAIGLVATIIGMSTVGISLPFV